jgi:hypothetical protein
MKDEADWGFDSSFILPPSSFTGWAGIPAVLLLTAGLYLPFVPAVFRYSRVLWIYIDRAIGPSEATASTFEKSRLAESRRE